MKTFCIGAMNRSRRGQEADKVINDEILTLAAAAGWFMGKFNANVGVHWVHEPRAFGVHALACSSTDTLKGGHQTSARWFMRRWKIAHQFQICALRKLPFLICAICICLLTKVQPALAAEGETKPALPVEGTWRWNFTMPDGATTHPKLKLKSENGQLTGTTSFRTGNEAPITNAIFDGNKLRFQVIRQREGQDIVTTYAGTWSSNAINGKIEANWDGEKQTFDWKAQRANIGIEGVWRWTNSFGPAPGGGVGRFGGGRGGGAAETRVELEQDGEKVTGKTVSRFGRPSSITNSVFTNGVVYFEIERVFFDNRSVTKFRGKQTGDKIKGTMESAIDGEDRTINWEATRVD